MTCLTASKLIFPLVLILLAQCNKTDAGSLSDIMQSILNVLKSIEGLLKDDSISLDSKSKHDSIVSQNQTGQKDLKSMNENINLYINDSTLMVKPNEEKKENTSDTTIIEGNTSRRSFTGQEDSNGNRYKTPKMRTKIEKESDEEEMDNSAEPTSNDEEDDELPEGDSADINENDSESDNDNEEIAARLFEESDEFEDELEI